MLLFAINQPKDEALSLSSRRISSVLGTVLTICNHYLGDPSGNLSGQVLLLSHYPFL